MKNKLIGIRKMRKYPKVELHNHIDFRIPDKGKGTIRQKRARNSNGPCFSGPPHRDTGNLELGSRLPRKHTFLPLQKGIDFASDLTTAQETNR